MKIFQNCERPDDDKAIPWTAVLMLAVKKRVKVGFGMFEEKRIIDSLSNK